ncbi:MAG: MBL fold metallo-hydrolase [Dehalococcoidia bacterium]|nr:MBL fold metallo-hydrolase [Dehalococcoidia bacterium]
MDPILSPNHYEPLEIAPETFLIRELTGEGVAPVNVYINSLVIRGEEPVIVDTGTFVNRERWLNDVFSLVDPKDVRYVFISHDDHDHVGNLRQVMELCPNATLIGNWFMVERLAGDIALPLNRMRWVNNGESFQAGDRTLTAIRPPVYDSPTTRGLYDSKTGVYWASDAFGMPVIGPTDDAGDLDPEFWRDGLFTFASYISPWHELADPAKFAAEVGKIVRLNPSVIATGHGPVSRGSAISRSFEFIKDLPVMEPKPFPPQAALEEIVAAMMAPEPHSDEKAA